MKDFLFSLVITPIYTIIECIYTLFHRFADSQGVCILGVSIGVTLLCLPLYAVAENWQEIERDKVKSMKPQIDRIKKYFSGDERYMMTTTYYKQCHYSPIMALRSSFGILIQIPFFIAAYTFLSNLSTLNGESFFLIENLAKPDAMIKIGSFTVNILPILMTAINIISGFIYTKGFALKEKLFPFFMALVFLFILYPSPSGLVLYWTMNNVFTLIKNIFYKLKNPLKSFWIFCLIAQIPFSIVVIFLTPTKWKYKIIYVFLIIILFVLPIIIKIIQKSLDTIFLKMQNDSALRAGIYFSASAVCLLLSGIAIPTSLVSSSPIEFSGIGANPNPLFFVFNALFQSSGFFVFWATAIYFLFGKKVKTILSIFMSIIAFSSIINAYIFMLPYGDISQTLDFLNSNVDFKTASPISALNAATLLFAAALILFLCGTKHAKILTSVSLIFCTAFAIFSGANIKKIAQSYGEYAKSGNSGESEKIEPIFTVSKTAPNVFVFMLDRASGKYVREILKENPSLKEKFSGFVHYNNALAYNTHTLQGCSSIYGGYEYTPLEMNRRENEELRDKHNQAALLLPRIFSEKLGFYAAISDPSWANYSDYTDLSFTDNYPLINSYALAGKYNSLWYKEHKESSDIDNTESVLKRNMIFFSFFRSSPIFLRELIYKKGTYWSADSQSKNVKAIMDWYSALDYMNELTEITDENKGSYNTIVNELTHGSILLEAPDFIPVKNVTNLGSSKFKEDGAYHTQMKAFLLLAKWFDFLKENGAYDNTRIILVSDHGNSAQDDFMEENAESDEEFRKKFNCERGYFHCLLMYKDFDAKGALKEDDDTFMTNADTPTLALKGLLENAENPFTKKQIPNLEKIGEIKQNGVFISANHKHVPLNHTKNKFNIKDSEWILVKDSIFKAENWTQKNPNEK